MKNYFFYKLHHLAKQEELRRKLQRKRFFIGYFGQTLNISLKHVNKQFLDHSKLSKYFLIAWC